MYEICRSGGTGRRTGLKIPRANPSCRFDSGLRHHSTNLISRGRAARLARRAHNPEVRRFKSPPRNQKRFHSRYNFGYGILLSIRKMPYFCPFTAHFGGFEGVFSQISDKSAILCPAKTEVADFVSFKGSIVQGINLQRNIVFSFALWYNIGK